MTPQFILRSALPAPKGIEIDNDDDKRAGDDALPERIEVEKVCAVVDGRQDEGADQRPLHRADRAEKAGPADDRRGDRLQFPALALGRIANADAHGEQNTDEGGAKARYDVGEIGDRFDVDAGQTRGLLVRADGE